MFQESYFIELPAGDRLHLKRMYVNPEMPPLFLLHGSIENGRIYYSKSGKGLGPYLARNGFDVFIADLRGRGESTPHINRHSHFSHTEAITEDIPAFIDFIRDFKGETPQQWIGHSWGGVLLSSFLARFPEYIPVVDSLVYFGSKRCVRVKNLHRLWIVEIIWKRIAPIIAALYGYLPARKLRFGSDDETRGSLQQTIDWLTPSPWIDPKDGFDYGQAITRVSLPPTLFIAATHDPTLGHPEDVKRFMAEHGIQPQELLLLSRQHGNLHNYDHITMLTHPDAPNDHFQYVLRWLREHQKQKLGLPLKKGNGKPAF